MSANHILIIDDDPNYLSSIAELLSLKGYKCFTSVDGIDCISLLEKYNIDLLLLDLRIPGKDGIQILEEVRQFKDDVPVIMISGQGEIKHAVHAIKVGAFDFLEKGESIEKMFQVIENALARRNFLREQNQVRTEIMKRSPFLGASFHTMQILETIKKVASTPMDILILGESGTGKELVARQIHLLSQRSDQKFIALNCANLSPNLIESDLFGHTRGSFTGAVADKKGKIEEADGGTLFLDEIGELPMNLQGKFLRALQEKEITPIGKNIPVKSDFRTIAASNKDIHAMTGSGKFRSDLYYRISQFTIRIPPLRERKDDIIPILSHYLEQFSNQYRDHIPSISEDVQQLLLDYPWPGNVRELRSFAENIVIFLEGEILDEKALRKVAEGPLINHPISSFVLS